MAAGTAPPWSGAPALALDPATMGEPGAAGHPAAVTIVAGISPNAAKPTCMPAIRSKSTAYSIVMSLCVVQFLLAVTLSRQSCDWSLSAYVVSGVIILGSMLMVPYLLRRAFPRHSRTPMALVFAMIGLVIWLLGLGVSFSGSGCGNL
jgi:hypothetical protein